MYSIQTLDRISAKGLDLLPRDLYETAKDIVNPDAILVRSFKMLDMELPGRLKAIARAGAGVNNIRAMLDSLTDSPPLFTQLLGQVGFL